MQSGDGFFTMVTPRLDAVEEVTLTTATAGADSAAQGATQVRFVTQSGTNTYRGTGTSTSGTDAQHEHVLQPAERAAAAQIDGGPVRRQHRRADRDPGSRRRARQGVLLLQLRGVLPAEPGGADAHGPESDSARQGVFTVQRQQPDARVDNLLALAARNGQIARWTRRCGAAPAQMRRGDADDRHVTQLRRTNSIAATTSTRVAGRGVDATRQRRGVDVNLSPTSSADRHLLLAAVQRRPGHAEQRRSDVPRIPGLGAPELVSARSGRARCDRRSVESRQRVLVRLAVVAERLLRHRSADMFTNQDGYILTSRDSRSARQRTSGDAGQHEHPQTAQHAELQHRQQR